jgi:hypothetical protein
MSLTLTVPLHSRVTVAGNKRLTDLPLCAHLSLSLDPGTYLCKHETIRVDLVLDQFGMNRSCDTMKEGDRDVPKADSRHRLVISWNVRRLESGSEPFHKDQVWERLPD